MFDFWEKIVDTCPPIENDERHDPVIGTNSDSALLEKISALEKQIAEMESKQNGSNLQNQSDCNPS